MADFKNLDVKLEDKLIELTAEYQDAVHVHRFLKFKDDTCIADFSDETKKKLTDYANQYMSECEVKDESDLGLAKMILNYV